MLKNLTNKLVKHTLQCAYHGEVIVHFNKNTKPFCIECEEEKEKKEKLRKELEAYIPINPLKIILENNISENLNEELKKSLKKVGGQRKLATNICLYGSTGAGKTLACYYLIYISIKANNYGIKLVKEDSLADMRINEKAEFNRIKNIKTLILDDVGLLAVNREYRESTLFSLFDWRYEAGLKTIITTNLNPVELKQYMGSRVYRRFSELELKFFQMKIFRKILNLKAV